MKKKRIITRRQMLRGAGGFALGLPFLPSLLARRGEADDPVFATERRFFSLSTGHGGIDAANMYPPDSWASEEHTLYAGHVIRRGALDTTAGSLSPVLTAAALTPALIAKMTVLRGLDIPFYCSHHSGGFLGNFSRTDAGGVPDLPMPTIDQLMAVSSSFYPTQPLVRSIHVGEFADPLSYAFENPSERSGVAEVASTDKPQVVLDRLFPPMDQPVEVAVPRTPIVDRVMEGYRSLVQSDRRLSIDDRRRLEAHLALLADAERSANALPLDCSTPDVETDLDRGPERFDALARVVAAGLACGATRIGVMGVAERRYVPFSGDWHQDVAHKHTEDGPQALLVEANRSAFGLFASVAAQLDSVEAAPGETVLDATLMTWTQESGEYTHQADSIPVITFGGAADQIATGQYIDYRNLATVDENKNGHVRAPGLLYRQYLATCLSMMGVPASEWEAVTHNADTGYGMPFSDASKFDSKQVAGVVENADDRLPFFAK